MTQHPYSQLDILHYDIFKCWSVFSKKKTVCTWPVFSEKVVRSTDFFWLSCHHWDSKIIHHKWSNQLLSWRAGIKQIVLSSSIEGRLELKLIATCLYSTTGCRINLGVPTISVRTPNSRPYPIKCDFLLEHHPPLTCWFSIERQSRLFPNSY